MQEDSVFLQNARFATRGFALLIGFLLMAGLGRISIREIERSLNLKITMQPSESPLFLLGMAALGIVFSVLCYQIYWSSTLYVKKRHVVRRYSLFGVTLYRQVVDLRKWTWVQPKTAFVGSKKFVVDAGNATEMNKTHLIEMPPNATWDETQALGRLIAERLSIECKPYKDRLMGIDSTQTARQ